MNTEERDGVLYYAGSNVRVDARAHGWDPEKDNTKEPTEQERMDAARRRAQWDLGDAAWANRLINAYLHPREDTARLEAEKREYYPWAPK